MIFTCVARHRYEQRVGSAKRDSFVVVSRWTTLNEARSVLGAELELRCPFRALGGLGIQAMFA